jgi:hypothetical protein
MLFLGFKHKTIINLSEDEQSKAEFQKKIEDIDEVIAQECSEENFQKIKDNFEILSTQQDSLNANGMWAIMKKVFPKNSIPPPVAKRNTRGQIITNPETLSEL